ncbi:hypothetical protein LTR10_010618 [Elasticomyces elasticus]|nr:hypothetical protein LTR10_010618 [Elasticomyces elasticus]KAK4968224.1 hypothetical protein LTR42_009507 [Elasticomyces elasticus]
MAWAQHAFKCKSWNGASSQDRAVVVPLPSARPDLAPTKETALGGVRGHRVGRRKSAPSILPSLTLRVAALQYETPWQTHENVVRTTTTHFSPSNTIALSYQDPYTSTTLTADSLRPSTPPTMPRSPLPADEHGVDPHQARKLTRLIKTVLDQRTKVDYQTDIWLNSHRYLNESAEALSTALGNTVGSTLTAAQQEQISTLRLEHRKDYDAIQTQIASFRELQSTLRGLEVGLKAEEHLVLQIVRSFTGASPANATDVGSQDADALAGNKSDTPPLLRQWINSKAGENLCRDRLMEHGRVHRDQCAQRNLVAERGDPLQLTDEEFENNYQNERQQLVKELESAEIETTILYKQCEAAGLDTDMRRSRVQGEDSLSDSGYDHLPIPVIHGDFFHDTGDLGMFNHQPVSSRHGHNIEGWLENVSERYESVPATEGYTPSIELTEIMYRDREPQAPPANFPSGSESSTQLKSSGAPDAPRQFADTIVETSSSNVGRLKGAENTLHDLPAALWSSRVV